MNILRNINRLIMLYVDTLRQVGRGYIWLILGLFFLVNWLVLFAHYRALSPAFYGPMKLWAELFGARESTGFFHYPGQFLILPVMFDWAKLAVGFVLEGAVLGLVALMFFDSYLEVKRPETSPLKLILSSWWQLILGWTLLNGLMLAAALILPQFMGEWLMGSPRRIMLLEFAIMPGLFSLFLAMLYSVIPSIAIYGDNVLEGLARSLRLFRRNPLTCLFMASTVIIGQTVVSVVAGRPVTIIDKFRPELVYWVLLAGLIVNSLASFVWIGTAVRLLVDEEE